MEERRTHFTTNSFAGDGFSTVSLTLSTNRSLISQKRISLSVSHYQRPTLSLVHTHAILFKCHVVYSPSHRLSPPTPKTCLSFSNKHYAIAYGIIKSKLATLLFSSYVLLIKMIMMKWWYCHMYGVTLTRLFHKKNYQNPCQTNLYFNIYSSSTSVLIK